jgi:hypothetical protein
MILPPQEDIVGRATYRAAVGPIRTASELADTAAIGVYLMLVGAASPFFRASGRAHPGQPVGIRGIKGDALYPPNVYLPVWVHRDQWKNVIVPVMDEQVIGWAGVLSSTGDDVDLPVTVYAPDGTVASTAAGTVLSSGETVGTSFPPSLRVGHLLRGEELVDVLRGRIRKVAEDAGY